LRHQSLLAYANFRYLKVAVVVVALTVGAYLWDNPPGGRNGGTWLGYALGTIGALLILWLLWFGIRKRRYSTGTVPLVAWLSAHVYLGATLIVIATLHAAFQVGLNVHTLAYLLMLFVIFSGFYGVYVYLQLPRLLTDNLGDETRSSLLLKITDLDRQAREMALGLPDDINKAVLTAGQETRIGGSWRRQLSGTDPDCATAAAVRKLQDTGKTLRGEQARTNQQLYTVMLRKQELLATVRRDVAFKARIDLWLYLHVPASLALLAALTAHVFSVFFYW
jgi:hypothetical protein